MSYTGKNIETIALQRGGDLMKNPDLSLFLPIKKPSYLFESTDKALIYSRC
ncbi:MAG: hypothetical protein Ct9H300mP20_02420 [Gammaproteobacteria bacterium]|nr:MAG: hypothetical protein Ct9H300mP20_02420 [Gammaproteobacteria bacterium]